MKIAIIQGHPDSRAGHFCNALASAYADGADSAGHELRLIDVAGQPFDLLRSKEDFEGSAVPLSLKKAQEAISWAEHLVIVYPLWLGSMPAILKGFFEQVFRPGFAFGQPGGEAPPAGSRAMPCRADRMIVWYRSNERHPTNVLRASRRTAWRSPS